MNIVYLVNSLFSRPGVPGADDDHLNQLLIDYVAKATEELRERAADILGWRSEDLHVTMGADIESTLYQKPSKKQKTEKDDGMKKKGHGKSARQAFKETGFLKRIDRVTNFIKRQGYPFLLDNGKRTHIDGTKVETHLKIGTPLEYIHHYRWAKTWIEHDVKTRKNTDLVFGSGHTHLGLYDGQDQDALPLCGKEELPLKNFILQGIVSLQRTYPALFLRPRTVEEGVKNPSGAYALEGGTSVRSNEGPRGSKMATIENRLSHSQRPEVSAALTLAGAVHGLDIKATHTYAFSCGQKEIYRGKRKFLDMVEDMVEKQDIYHFFGAELGKALVDDCLDRYEVFLDNGTMEYTQEDEAAAKQRVAQLRYANKYTQFPADYLSYPAALAA